MRIKKYSSLLFVILLIVLSFSTVSTLAAAKTITFWHYWTNEEGKSLENIVAEFNKTHKDFQVKSFSNLDYDQHHVKLQTAIAGGAPPDVSVCSSDFMPEWVVNGALLPLDDYIKKDKFNLADFYVSSIQLGKYNGKIYGLALCQDSYALLWNKTLFKKAGLDPEKPPRTIAELDKMIEKLTITDSKGNIKQAGFIPDWPWSHNYQIAFAFGGDFYDAKNKKITANDPNVIKAMEWELSIYKKYGFKALNAFKTGHSDYGSAGYAFYTGEVAMVIDGEWQPTHIRLYAPKDFQWGVAPFPGVKNDPKMYGQTQTTSSSMIIPKGSKNQKEAWEFIKWIETKEAAGKFCQEISNVPPFKSLGANPNFTSDPRFSVFMKQLDNPCIKIWPQMPISNSYQKKYQNAEESVVVTGEKTSKQALDDLNKEMQAALDKALKKLK